MKPPVFEYLAPRSLDEALELTARAGDGTVPLAGGQSLLPLLNHRRVRPVSVVDLNGLPGLDTVEYDGSSVRIGALTRLRALERDTALAAALPVLRETVRLVAHPQIRSRSTLGGSLCHADPAAELPALALALDARLRLRSVDGERTVEARDFYRPGGATARWPGELLVSGELPLHDGFRFCFTEVTRSGQGGFPLVGICAGVRCDATGRVAEARLAGAGVADRPLRLTATEQALTGRRFTPPRDDVDEVVAAARDEADPPPGPHGSSAYRTALLGTVVRRALARLAGEGDDGEGRKGNGGGGTA